MPVNSERSDYMAMKEKWSRLRDCFGGRDTVLKAGEKYVPSLPAKDANENEAYRKRGNFYNALKRTVQGMVGAVFQEPPEVECPEAIKPYLDDITLTNVPFEMFAQETGNEVMLTARYGVLVDMPVSLATTNRPYCIGYKAEDIINWKTTRVAGNQVLTMVVLRESTEVPDPKDEFVHEVKTQYRVVQLTTAGCQVQMFKENENKKGEFVTDGPPVTLLRRGIPLDFIPFVFICAINATPDLEDPPLVDLADVNLGHWRNSVDHEYGLHLVALPTPWVSGAKNSGDGSTPMKIGPSVVWELDIQGSAGMLEFSGEGLASLVSAMDEKKKQMAALGARLLEDSASVQETASAVKMRHSGEHASLRTVAQALEVGFMLVIQIVTWWVGIEEKPVDTEVSVELKKEYLDIKASAQDVQSALAALQANEISYETWWNILMTGGWGREGVTADDEQKAIDERKKKKELEKPKPEPGVVPVKKIVRDANGYISEIQG